MRSRNYLSLVLVLLALLGGIWYTAAARQPRSGEPDRQPPGLGQTAVQGASTEPLSVGWLSAKVEEFSTPGRREAEQEKLRMAARQGDARAQYELGHACLADCWHEEWKRLLALKWLTKAAEQGVGEAWLDLGHLYAEGGPGVLQDLAQARECYRKAEEKAPSLVWKDLGGVYRWGKGGITADWPRSLGYYLKSARQGDRDSQYVVGQFYQYGIGTAADLSRAVEWYTKAAEQGDTWAEEKLGWLYEHGIGVAKDRRKAIDWYKKCEKHGGHCGWHLRRLNDPETLKQTATAPPPFATTKDVEITLQTDKNEYELDELIIISICYRNVGKDIGIVGGGAGDHPPSRPDRRDYRWRHPCGRR